MVISIYLLTAALLLLVSIFSSKLSLKYGIPALLIFLAIGMIFGSDGLNVVYFEDYELAQHLGIVALIYILFSGGLDTKWYLYASISSNSSIGVSSQALNHHESAYHQNP